MSFDGFITKSVVTELKNVIIGAKVNKIFQPTKTDVVLGLYNNGTNYALNLCTNPEFCRINLTTHQKPNPQNAYNFCMLLRKYLTGAKIINISNYDLERTIEIKFECYNELNDLIIRKLFIEIMSRQSNIILTNDKNIIIDTLRHTDTQTRELLPAHEFEFTSINKNSFLELQNVDEFTSYIYSFSNISLDKILYVNFIGFSKIFTRETLKYLNIDENNYTLDDLTKLYNYLKEVISFLGTDKLYYKENESKNDYTLFIDNRNSSEPQYSLNLNWFLDDYYTHKEQEFLFTNSRNSLLKIVSTSLNKVYKKLENINNKLKTCDDREQYRLYGELLTANLYRFNNNAITNEVIVNNYYNNNSPIKIPLDTRLTIQKNVEKYYKKYNKLKNTLDICSEQKKDTEKELDYISSIVFSLKNAKNLNDIHEVYNEISENVLTKKEIINKEKHTNSSASENKIRLENITIDNYTIYIGKNNVQNDYLSLKFANSNDIWFHVQKMHGSHVLLKNSENQEIDEIPENVLYTCSKLAKENSKASESLNVPVDYCYARYVKKLSGAKPGMVIYNNFKTIIVK